MKKWFHPIIVCSILLCLAWDVQAENWPNWRGPHYNGSAQAENLPPSWSHTENVVWKTAMPGESAATPIIWNDKVFVSSLDKESGNLVAMCLNRENGEVLWKKDVGIDFGNWRRQNKASPSPVTDGERVFFLYGTGDMVGFDTKGNELWKRNMEEEFGKFVINWGYGSSPLLYKGKLYFLLLQRKESFLLAIDPATGKDLWKHIRPNDARQESQEAYSTPIPFVHDGREEILIFGGDCLTGHDPETGKELFRWADYNPKKIGHWRIVTSPVPGKDNIFVAGPKRAPLYAIRAGGNGSLGKEYVAWTFDDNPPDVCTSLLMDDLLYVFDGDRHVLTCLDPQSGRKYWELDAGGKTVYRASPTGGDGKIYVINEDGLVVVFQAGKEGKELFRYEMGEASMRASIAIAGNQIFIRTGKNVYCIANKSN